MYQCHQIVADLCVQCCEINCFFPFDGEYRRADLKFQACFRATPVNKANFEEIPALYHCTLEYLALRQSIANATPDWEKRLILTHQRIKKAAVQTTAIYEDVDKTFNMALIAGSGSPLLERYCTQQYDLNIRYRS